MRTVWMTDYMKNWRPRPIPLDPPDDALPESERQRIIREHTGRVVRVDSGGPWYRVFCATCGVIMEARKIRNDKERKCGGTRCRDVSLRSSAHTKGTHA
jgi:hypothetical protein